MQYESGAALESTAHQRHVPSRWVWLLSAAGVILLLLAAVCGSMEAVAAAGWGGASAGPPPHPMWLLGSPALTGLALGALGLLCGMSAMGVWVHGSAIPPVHRVGPQALQPGSAGQSLPLPGELELSMVRHAVCALLLVDMRGVILAMNPAAGTLLRCGARRVVGVDPLVRYINPNDLHNLAMACAQALGRPVVPGVDCLLAALGEGPTAEHEMTLQCEDGHTFPATVTTTLLRDGAGQASTLLVMAQDLSRNHRIVNAVTRMAFTDRLTGLANRSRLEHELPRVLRAAQQHQHPLALMFIDLDGFKLINDEHGHAAGDKVLREVARRLKAVTRTSDLVVRLGGDEFVVVLPTLADEADASLVARKVLEAVRVPITSDPRLGLPGQPEHVSQAHPSMAMPLVVQVQASIGLATFPRCGHVAKDLLRVADAAMYAAKRAGRNQVREAQALDDGAVGSPHAEALAQGQEDSWSAVTSTTTSTQWGSDTAFDVLGTLSPQRLKSLVQGGSKTPARV